MIKVSEHFYTIQGEGPNVGVPSYIVRFSGCNFRCNNCDSKFSWNKDEGEDLKEVVKNLNIPEQCNNVIITGGEPSLYFDDDDFKLLLEKIISKRLEIETTALPDISLLKTSTVYDTLYKYNGNIYRYKKDNIIAQYRISPKLDISCYNDNSITIEDIIRYYKITKHPRDWPFIYKIVFYKANEKIIERFIDECARNPMFRMDRLFIMPFTPSPDNLMYPNLFWTEYVANCEETIEFCKKHGLRYTPRVHIDVYGVERGF